MDDFHKAHQIFEEWKTDFDRKSMSEKRRERVPENFINLFATLHYNKIDVETASGYIVLAAKAHFPDDDIAKVVYKRIPGRKAPFAKFLDGWKKEIKGTAQEVFYQVYPKLHNDGLEEEKQRVRDKLQAKKVEDVLSTIEYNADGDEAWVDRLLSFTKPLTAEEYQAMVDQRERILSERDLNG